VEFRESNPTIVFSFLIGLTKESQKLLPQSTWPLSDGLSIDMVIGGITNVMSLYSQQMNSYPFPFMIGSDRISN
jgi:hypothetical protein